MSAKEGVPATLIDQNTLHLSVKDRLIIPSLFPKHGTLSEQIMAIDIVKKIQIQEEQYGEMGVEKHPDGRLAWKDDNTKTWDFFFSSAEIQYLKELVGKMDRDRQVSVSMVETFLKIKNA